MAFKAELFNRCPGFFNATRPRHTNGTPRFALLAFPVHQAPKREMTSQL